MHIGEPIKPALECATSNRRSERLAQADAEAIAEQEGRVYCHAIGRLTAAQAREIRDHLRVPLCR